MFLYYIVHLFLVLTQKVVSFALNLFISNFKDVGISFGRQCQLVQIMSTDGIKFKINKSSVDEKVYFRKINVNKALLICKDEQIKGKKPEAKTV